METIQTSLTHTVVPPSAMHAGPHPALIMLHGRGADENDLLGLAEYLDPRFFIIGVRAPFQFSYSGFAWYEVLEVGKPEPRQFAESYERLSTFLGDVKQQYPIDPSRVMLMGFSMGTMMSYSLALTKPDEICAVVAHSGYIPEGTDLQFQWNRLKSTSFFIAHGVHDPVIPVQLGRRAKELLSKTDAPVTYKEYPIAHQISEESLKDMADWLHRSIDHIL